MMSHVMSRPKGRRLSHEWNILRGGADVQDKGLDEAFWPIFQLEEASKDKNSALQAALRAGVGIGLAGMCYALYHHAPDKGRSFFAGNCLNVRTPATNTLTMKETQPVKYVT